LNSALGYVTESIEYMEQDVVLFSIVMVR
jgi:hypothetical protein